jgi:hypothetical protein
MTATSAFADDEPDAPGIVATLSSSKLKKIK